MSRNLVVITMNMSWSLTNC